MFPLEDAIDLHVHAAPDVTPRAGDDVELARECAASGMAGMAVKGHVESTASRAHHTNQQVPGFRYIGGICLNYPVGGINPTAVEACFRLGGRIVWMPSGHSRFHAELTGQLGHWDSSGMTLPNPSDPREIGLTVFDEAGELTRATKEVVALVKEHRGLLATSHLSPSEIVALARYCGGEHVKLVVTHIRWTPAYDLKLARTAVEHGAIVEITASSLAGHAIRFPIAEAIAMMRELTPASFILASDTGGVLSVKPHEALRVLASNLLHRGVSRADLNQMLSTNPRRLVDE